MNDKRVRDISEFELIGRLRDALPAQVRTTGAVVIGIGDDAAVWQPPVGESVLISTDSLIDTVHFRTDWTSWNDLGWKALAVNISDIAAMGGVPALATVSLALTGDELVSDLEMLYRGMGEIAARENVAIAGGDIVRAPHDFGIHVTVLGSTRNGGQTLTRTGARPGDLVAVTGLIGAAAAGLNLYQLDLDDPRRTAASAALLLRAFDRPEPRVRAGQLALDTGATAAMDLSDGLYGDLPKILRASDVAGVIDLAALPIPASVRALFPDRFLDLATRGGEDYELLLTVPPDRFSALADQLAAIDQTITIVGEIVSYEGSGERLVARDLSGTLQPVSIGAFDHFQSASH